jgi:hypothetical protein
MRDLGRNVPLQRLMAGVRLSNVVIVIQTTVALLLLLTGTLK